MRSGLPVPSNESREPSDGRLCLPCRTDHESSGAHNQPLTLKTGSEARPSPGSRSAWVRPPLAQAKVSRGLRPASVPAVRPVTDYADTSVLVTGGQGFIGCWLTERLLALGARVIVPRRDLHPRVRFRTEGIEERCEVVSADIRAYDSVLHLLTTYRISTVFHLAAQPIVGVANRAPLSTFESNVRGTYTVLEACRAAATLGEPIERIVVASTDHAYGAHEELPYREDFALCPSYPYDVSKGCTDMIARCYAHTYELPIAVTRLANVYGGGDLNWSRIVPDCARALVLNERPVIRSDGTPERDYLYVKDAVDVYLAVADSVADPELRGRAWNAGHGRPVAVLEVVRRLIAVSGKDLEPEVCGASPPRGEIDRQYLDSTAIRETLGWSPRWDLDRGLEEAYRWYERELGLNGRRQAGQVARTRPRGGPAPR